MSKKKIIIPLPSYGFDTSEVAIPWKILTENGFDIDFTTPNGQPARTDTLMLKGERLGIWKSVLMARKDAVNAYLRMEESEAFRKPIRYSEIKESDYDGLFLPGGHDKGVKEYLESAVLQNLVAAFFKSNKPVSAICHGVVLAARSIDSSTGKSVLYDYKTTSLLKTQELTGYQMTRLWLKDYYLTYPNLTVEDEVKSVLRTEENFKKGPFPISRDDMDHLDRGFVVKDRNYSSARWPGDVYSLSLVFMEVLSDY